VTTPAERVEELYGTWTLVSWTRRLLDTGETVEAFGKAPRGFLSYGRDGRVFFIMTKENRARPDDLTRLTDAERAELYNTMVAYAGTFTFDGTVATCHVDVSWNEAWTGTAQVRGGRQAQPERLRLGEAARADHLNPRRAERGSAWHGRAH
jgi:hypothetical protein